MTIGEELKGNFPKTIRKDGKVFSCLVANTKQTGAMESILNDVERFNREYYGTPNVYEQTGDLLNKTIKFYSFLERFVNETEEGIKRRLAAIFVRNNDEVWGTPFDIRNVFRQYFPSAKIFLVENVNSTLNDNLIVDGDIQEDSPKWILSDNSIISTEARFSKTYGFNLENDAYASQSVQIEHRDIEYVTTSNDTYESIAKNNYGNSQMADYIRNYSDNLEELTPGTEILIPSFNVYFLHFFLQGNCKVQIKNNLNEYWNPITELWETEENYTEFSADEWSDKSVFFMCKNDITNVTITFAAIDKGYVDYIRLFQKYKHPSFCIIAHFEGNAQDEALALATGRNDDEDAETHTEGSKVVIDGPEKFNNFGYFDGAYLTGVASGFAQDLYDDLVNYVKAQGVKAYIETVNRDSIDE